jgi:hypothetical protein
MYKIRNARKESQPWEEAKKLLDSSRDANGMLTQKR